MRKVFIDSHADDAFKGNGYFVIKNLLNEEDIRLFTEFYSTIPAASQDTFYSSHWNDDPQYRKHIDQFLQPLLYEKVKDRLHKYRPIYGYFLVKMPGEKGIVSVHQDWMLVDESRYVGVTMWIPLVDTSLENGSFQVIENSHKFLSQIRGSHTHFPYRGDLQDVHNRFLTNINLKRGDAILFDHKLAHASLPNFSPNARVAVGLVLVPQEAQLIHYYFDHDKKEARLYEVDDNFLIEYGLRDSPDRYKFLKKMNFTNPILPIENLETAYSIHKGI